MTRLNILLAIALILSSLGLVASQHQARKSFIELERSQAKAKLLETQYEQLQVEHSQWTKSSFIDSKARRDLRMQPLDPARVVHFNVAPERTPVTAKAPSQP